MQREIPCTASQLCSIQGSVCLCVPIFISVYFGQFSLMKLNAIIKTSYFTKIATLWINMHIFKKKTNYFFSGMNAAVEAKAALN